MRVFSQGGGKNEKECRRQRKEPKGNCLVKPPDEKEQPSHHEAQQRLDLSDSNRRPTVCKHQHLHHRYKVEEEGHAGRVDANPAPSLGVVENCRENSDTTARVENGRNS